MWTCPVSTHLEKAYNRMECRSCCSYLDDKRELWEDGELVVLVVDSTEKLRKVISQVYYSEMEKKNKGEYRKGNGEKWNASERDKSFWGKLNST